ncbi:MAG: DUF4143 domain-containing protein, partial [bacterium]|nr:DUF4143 domain-containing protein [bacterium]
AGRDSLAGRITTLETGVPSLTEIARFRGIDLGEPFFDNRTDNGLHAAGEISFWQELRELGRARQTKRDQAFSLFAERGGYPIAHLQPDLAWSELSDQLNETVITRMLKQDLRVGPRDEKLDASLLEAIFRLACRYAGQTPSAVLLAREAQRSLTTEVSPLQVREYLRYLDDSLLVRLITGLELRLKKEKRHNKICLADHGLRASWLGEAVPLVAEDLAKVPHLTVLAGHLAESIVGATLLTIRGLDIAHRPATDAAPEIDFVLTLGMKRIPLEVKYQRRIDPRRDTRALRAFLDDELNQASFGLLVTPAEVEGLERGASGDPRFVALPLASLMLLR